jgi:hypothetical protein
LLVALVAGIASVAGAAAAQTPNTNTTPSTGNTPDTTKRILVLPALEWDPMGKASHPVGQRTASDLARVMGGLQFGLKPEEVSNRLPKIGGELRWSDLPPAKEFSDDVRFVRMPMQDAGALRPPGTACFGATSYVVLLFRNNALFRVSWRFLPDQGCPSTRDTAEALYATCVPLAATLAVSTLYHTGSAEVVDVTDPGAGALAAQRWQKSMQ